MSTLARLPKGIPYIIGNEAAERFSYYGMRGILVIFLTQYVVNHAGAPDHLTDAQARQWYHTFSMGVYFFPIIGSLISDALWGKYRTILSLSIVYCLGHLTLAMFETQTGFMVGLTLIAIGSGGIKPCVSAHVGDQFGEKNKDLLDKTFAWFYFSINLGASTSTILTPLLLNKVGPWAAFGVPGVLMCLATYVFWLGRNKFVHVPPTGLGNVFKTIKSKDGVEALLKLGVIYLFVAMFWALYDQTGSSWILQAKSMDRHVNLFGWRFELLPSQIQAINPILIMAFVPLFYNFIFPMIDRKVKVTPLRKMCTGFFITAASFGIVAYVESLIEAGQTPSVLWQLFAYVIITIAEVLVSITALEFSYTQAPNALKSIIMGVFFLSVSLGNFFTAMVNMFIQNEDGTSRLTGTEYYLFFTAVVFVAGFLFVFVARNYKEKTYIQTTQEEI